MTMLDNILRTPAQGGDYMDNIYKQQDKVESLKANLLSDPAKIDSRIASAIESVSPVVARPKYNKFGTKVEAVDASIPEDHPMQGVAQKTKDAFTTALTDPANYGVDPNTIFDRTIKNTLSDSLDKSYVYKAKADSAASNLFGIFGESKKLAKPAGYDTWKKQATDAHAAEVDKEASGPGTYATNATIMSAIGGITGGPLGAVTGAALSVPATFAGELARHFAKDSDYATFHGEDTGYKVAGAVGGIALGLALGGKSALVKTGASALLGAMGYADPTSNLDFASFVGVEGLLKKGGTALLNKALAAGTLSNEAREAMTMHPSAANVIKAFDAGITEKKVAQEAAEAADRSVQLKVLRDTQISKSLADVSDLTGAKFNLDELKGITGSTAENMSPEGRDKLSSLLRMVLPDEEVSALLARPRAKFEGPASPFPRDVTDVSTAPGKKELKAVTTALSEEQNKLNTGAYWDSHVDTIKSSLGLTDDEIIQLGKSKDLTELVAAVKNKPIDLQFNSLDEAGMADVLAPSPRPLRERIDMAATFQAMRERMAKVASPLSATAEEIPKGPMSWQEMQSNITSITEDSIQKTLWKGGKTEAKTIEPLGNSINEYQSFLDGNMARIGIGVVGAGALTGISNNQDQKTGGDIAYETTEHFINLKSVISNVVDFLSPASAEAAEGKMLASLGIKTTEAVANLAQGKSLSETVKSILPFAGKDTPVGAISAKENLIRNIPNTAPRDANELIAMIATDGKAPMPGMTATSPQFGASTMFKNISRPDGTMYGSAAVQLAAGQGAIKHNVMGNYRAVDGILSTFVPDAVKESSADIMRFMKPAQETFDGVGVKYQMLTNAADAVRTELDTIKGLLKDALPEERSAIHAEIAAKEKMLDDFVKERKGYQVEYDKNSAYVEHYQMQAAKQWSRARISFLAEDPEFKKYPWLEPMVSEGEKKAAIAVQDMMLDYKERAMKQGMNVLSEDYITHSRQLTDAQQQSIEEMNKYFSGIGMDAKTSAPLLKFFSRTEISKQFIPDIEYNLKSYIPDAERRLMANDFWKPNKAGGWEATKNSYYAQSNEALKAYFTRIENSFRPVEDTNLNKLANGYATLESVRLLAGGVSAPFKHLFKLVPEMGRLGITNVLPVYPSAAMMTIRNFAREGLTSLADRGFVSADFANNFLKGSKPVDEFANSIIGQHGMMNFLTDIELKYDAPYKSAASNFVDSVSTMSGFGIKAIESFDRSVTLLATIRMLEKKGTTGQQAIYSVLDTVLKNNFLSGQLNPAWGRDPKVRAAFMFQQTPFKILESRLSDAIITGRDVKTAWGMIKSGELEKTYQEMKMLKGDMAEGAMKFKAGILYDAVTASKDVFGNPISAQFVKQILGVGAMLVGGHKLGMDFTPQLLHLPFITTEGEENKLSLSPAIKAASGTLTGAKPPGDTDWDPEEHDGMLDRVSPATFFKHWYGTAGYSLFASKMGRISENDIPEIYRDSKWKYMFSVKNVD